MNGYTLFVLPGRYAIAKIEQGSPETRDKQLLDGLYAWILDREGITIVSNERSAPRATEIEYGWRAMKVAGNLDFSLVGVLAGVSGVLASAGVSIFVISSYKTDYILVKEENLLLAVGTLQNAGYQVTVEA
jgi:uncharacterized protein